MVENKPTSYREAVTSSEGQQWREAIKSEIESILQNHTWELVDLPPGCKSLGYKWIFKKKMKAHGTVDKYKARLILRFCDLRCGFCSPLQQISVWEPHFVKLYEMPHGLLVPATIEEMASLLVKRVASNLSRVRTIASSSRFFSTKGYEFVQHDTKDECILKCEDSIESSAARGVVNDTFSPHVSPTENLARLLNFSDWRVEFIHGTHLFPRWSVVEDDKALYILRDMTAKGIEDVRESVKEFMTGNHEENFKGAITISEEECISEDVIEYLKQIDPGRNAFPIIDIMRGDEYAPTGDYYYHVMKDAKEVKQFVESLHGSQDKVDGYSTWIKIYGESHNPQALYIIVVSGDPQIRNPYGGYAVEIFLDNSLYNVCDMKFDSTGDNRKLFIPKKKVEGNETNPMAPYIGSRLLHGL
ncbi:hypothetical protein Tco_0359703 [Tanacetum coccineum]